MVENTNANRRRFLKNAGAVGVTLGVAGCTGQLTGGGTPDEVNIGLCLPLSGQYANVGELTARGAEFGVKRINEGGGIEALDGAEINLISTDAGETPDSASTAATELLEQNDVVASMGCWLSSMTVAATEIAERKQIPWMTQSFSDEVTARGLKYVFQVSPHSSVIAKRLFEIWTNVAERNDKPMEQLAIIADDTSASRFFAGAVEERAPEFDIEIILNESWNPPLSDATPLVRSIKDADPDLVFTSMTSLDDASRIRSKWFELDVGLPSTGLTTTPIIPEYLQVVGADNARNVATTAPTFQMPGMKEVVKEYIEWSDDPFLPFEVLTKHGEVHILKEGIEQTGSTDPQELRDALADISITEGWSVDSFPTDTIEFADTGHMTGAQMLLAQWQERGDHDYLGAEVVPFTVAPPDLSLRKINWPS